MASTCGTSLLTNNASVEMRALLTRVANRRADELSGDPRRDVDQRIADVDKAMAVAAVMDAARASAELHGIIAFYGGGWPREARRDTHVLLHTDTYLGTRATEIVRDYLEREGVHASLQCMRKLTTASGAAFEAGMEDAVDWCQETDREQRANGVHVVYNLSGGFKSWQGYMSALGMLYADELVYIFEQSDELIRIPRLPLSIDSGEVVRHFDPLRRMHVAPVPAEEAVGVRESLVTVRDGVAKLSFLGLVLFEACARQIYETRLLEPPHALIRFGPHLEESARRWEGRRQMADINRRVDALAKYLIEGRRHMPAGLDLKGLQGDPQPPSDHEFDLWSDGAAWRGFGHFEGKVFVIDRVGLALHH